MAKDERNRGWLVLDRKAGQEIEIGEGIRIKIKQVHGSHVSVAIKAPQGVNIRRTEVQGDGK